VPGDKKFIPGLGVGDFAVPHGEGGHKIFKGSAGFVAMIVGFDREYVEYLPNRGPRVRSHGVDQPVEAKWLDRVRDGVEKTGLWMPNGNRVVGFVHAYMIVDGFAAVYDFYSSAYPIGVDLADRAQRLRAKTEIDGKPEIVKGCALGKYLFKSFLDRDGDMRWYKPSIPIIGKLGEARGPTIDEWRYIQGLRRAHKQGLEWMPDGPPDPPAIEASSVVEINAFPTEIRPPPHEGEMDWEIDDEIKF
jgi:hypothetical protein